MFIIGLLVDDTPALPPPKPPVKKNQRMLGVRVDVNKKFLIIFSGCAVAAIAVLFIIGLLVDDTPALPPPKPPVKKN